MNDTTICSGDTIQLRIVSDGLRYSWTPANQLINATVKNPLAITAVTTPYNVIASIGGCSANEQVTVTAIPFPSANAGKDTEICYKAVLQLHATTDGTSWQWSPALTLTDPLLLDPVASPLSTTPYIFTAYENTRGCPKPGRDTILVTILPKIIPFAGRDTAIVTNQELQLNATGGSVYLWSPANNLSATNIADPVALFTEPSAGIIYKVKIFNSAGCVDSASITIKVFATLPAVFVPTAFTPNNDGKNDLLIPIAAGIKRIEYFSVYNRWGQLVFTTSVNGHGWDGKINGQPQATNTYIWMVKAVDFRGLAYFQKGQTTLIR
jgi:gliding motility-associated-like protein